MMTSTLASCRFLARIRVGPKSHNGPGPPTRAGPVSPQGVYRGNAANCLTKVAKQQQVRRNTMQHLNMRKAIGLIMALAFFIGGTQTALAVGTASGTSIDNTATVDYQVSGISQSQLTSNTASFVVDNRVDLTVADSTGTYVNVVPGSTAQVLTWTVRNTGNTAQDFALSAAAGTDPYGGTDNFNATNANVYVESGATPGYQPAEDTATFIDELTPDTTVIVYGVADIPVTQVNGDIAAYTLTADAHDAGAAGLGAVTNNTVGGNTAGVDVVLADGAGDTDLANQGDHSATAAFRVVTANLFVSKSVAVISDPFNGSGGNQKAIPGATMRYTISVQNTSTTTAATSVVVVDTPPATTTYTGSTITLDTVGKSDASDADEADWNVTNAGAVTVTIPTLAASTTATITFDVTIN